METAQADFAINVGTLGFNFLKKVALPDVICTTPTPELLNLKISMAMTFIRRSARCLDRPSGPVVMRLAPTLFEGLEFDYKERHWHRDDKYSISTSALMERN